MKRTAQPLHHHQQLAVDHLQDWFRSFRTASAPAGYLEMPTGSGKTFTIVSAIEPFVAKKRAVLWIAHNGSLLDQAQKTFERKYGRIGLGRIAGRQKELDEAVTFATIQTLAASGLKTLESLCESNRPELVVFDEFHRSAADTWKKVVALLKKSGIPILGLSATPTRTTAEKRAWLHRTFSHPVFRVGLTELVQGKPQILARPTVYRVPVKGESVTWSAAELRHLRTFHDAPPAVLKRLGEQEARNRLVIRTYKTQPGIDRALVFCCGVDHAEHLARRFVREGVPAAAVTGSADDPDNRAALAAFEAGEVRVLTSVILLTEGVDLPSCDTVMLARPTQSEILLKQMMGRALRGPAMGGSETCTIVDFVDAFTEVGDISSTSLAFMREYDEALAPVLRARPTRKSRDGVDLATLLRIRDWLARQGDVTDARGVFLEEVDGVLEFYDGAAGVNRAVLVPKKEKAEFKRAVDEVRSTLGRDPDQFEDPVSAAAATRRVYADRFDDGSSVTEEDFVNVVAHVTQSEDDVHYRQVEALEALADAPVLGLPLVKKLEGLDRLLDALGA